MPSRLSILLLLPLLLTCDLDDRKLQVLKVKSFCDQYIAALVNRQFACRGGSPGRAAAVTAEKLAVTCAAIDASLAGEALAFDGRAGQACLRELETVSCQESPPSCPLVYVGRVPAFSACFSAGVPDECAPGSRCVLSAQCPGSCVPYAQLGDPCSTDDYARCGPGLTCNSNGACQAEPAPPKLGDSCASGSCGDWVCEGPAGTLPAGSAEGTCQAPRSNGPCHASFECDGRCVGLSPTSLAGTCQPWRSLGESCVPDQEECGAGTYCGGENRCVELPVLGESCAGNGKEGKECVDSLCSGAQAGSLCLPLGRAGESCGAHNGLIFGGTCEWPTLGCDETTRVCLPRCLRNAGCGGLDQICCLGRTCNPGKTCAGQTCVMASGCQRGSGFFVFDPLIADFSDAVTTTAGISVGAGGRGLAADSYIFAAPGLSNPMLSLTTQDIGAGPRPALWFRANPEQPTDPANPWIGFGLAFRSCIVADHYAGVTFTITGDLGTNALSFGAVFGADLAANLDPKGRCAAPPGHCVTPFSGPLPTGKVSVRFTEIVGGSPQPTVNPAELTAIEWRLSVPTAPAATRTVASFTVADVAFFQ
ncbi:MAG TPA: hypothetical protein VFH68_10280 [Polyangia bacterium]|jgi:hypothetical protein|nr:hypothetical protein [Polyangia bacterium]